jgi:hypothetical protein
LLAVSDWPYPGHGPPHFRQPRRCTFYVIDLEQEVSKARFLRASRSLIVVPVLGLGDAAVFFFVFGGIGLFALLIETLVHLLGGGNSKNELI